MKTKLNPKEAFAEALRNDLERIEAQIDAVRRERMSCVRLIEALDRPISRREMCALPRSLFSR